MEQLARRLRSRVASASQGGQTHAPNLDALLPFALGDRRVLQKLYAISQDVTAREVPGDLVECGVLNGGSAAALAMAAKETERGVWLYDSFQGLPPARAVDGPEAAKLTGACAGSVDRVREAMDTAGFPWDRCVVRAGWFHETFALPGPEKVALLHVDADWYESVIQSLEAFYDRVSPGGVIVLDDFGHWEGCREAYYDFTRRRDLKPLLERFSHTQAFWVKGRENNRAFLGKWEIP